MGNISFVSFATIRRHKPQLELIDESPTLNIMHPRLASFCLGHLIPITIGYRSWHRFEFCLRLMTYIKLGLSRGNLRSRLFTMGMSEFNVSKRKRIRRISILSGFAIGNLPLSVKNISRSNKVGALWRFGYLSLSPLETAYPRHRCQSSFRSDDFRDLNLINGHYADRMEKSIDLSITDTPRQRRSCLGGSVSRVILGPQRGAGATAGKSRGFAAGWLAARRARRGPNG